jgi:hypothetical protein
MILLNFSHPLTGDQVEQIRALTGQEVERMVEIPTQFDPIAPFGPQVTTLADQAGLTPREWQTSSFLIVPPALNFVAVLLLAELHGRMGYFCPCVRLKSIAGTLPPRHEVAEILDLQAQRDVARTRR